VTQSSERGGLADVYAGDTGAPDLSPNHWRTAFLFTIEADAEPDAWARIANLFNVANVAPLNATLHRPSPHRVHMSVRMGRINPTTADMIQRKLLQLTCVTSVELTGMTATGQDDVIRTDAPAPGPPT
jgi:hypothetical protein